MVDRRAVIVGSWQALGRDKPSQQRVRSITDRWSKIFDDDTYELRSLANRQQKPVPRLNPTRGELLGELADHRRTSADTELLFHFLGHSVSRGADDIDLILKVEDGENTMLPLSQLIDALTRIPCGPLILILDTCHVGRTQPNFDQIRQRCYTMMATGSSYAYNADFSDGLLRAFEAPLRGKDQRIDRRAGGVTYAKMYQEATRRILTSTAKPMQQPIATGDMGSRVLITAPPIVPDSFSPLGSARTVYGRTYELLALIDERHGQAGFLAAVQGHPAFVLEHDTGRTISEERIQDYVRFLRKVRWVVEPAGQLQLTASGQAARNPDQFNRQLLAAIEQHILPPNLGYDRLEDIVKELLDDMIPPTPSRIRERAGMNGVLLTLDTPTRVALSLLPTTGRFLKGSADAIFPYDPVGAG